jgi:hypothetical protein
MAVGAPGDDNSATGINGSTFDNLSADSGAVYVFTRSGSSWSQQAYVKASNTGTGDYFGGVGYNYGHALALSDDGNTLAVGARLEASGLTGVTAGSVSEATAGNSAYGAGVVYVFSRSGSNWSQQAFVKASIAEFNDYFGNAVSLSGDGNVLAVSAPQEDSNARGVGGSDANNSSTNSGAVYLFRRTGGVWSQQSYIKAPNNDPGDNFGFSLALSGDGNALVIGADFERGLSSGVGGDQTSNGSGTSGAVYLY